MTNSSKLLVIISEIKEELSRIDMIKEEHTELIKKIDIKNPEQHEVRAIGSILHDFYSGIERIFRKIATEVDEGLPKGVSWHRDLLKRMSIKINKIRPAVISNDLADDLDEYLRFRHIFRNVYGFALKWKKVSVLSQDLPDLHSRITKEIHQFIDFLKQLP